MVTAERSRSVDNNDGERISRWYRGADQSGVGALGQQVDGFRSGDAHDVANLVEARGNDDEGGMATFAARRLLEAGDVVDTRRQHRGGTLEQTGETVDVHGWRAWSQGILEASLAGVISPM